MIHLNEYLIATGAAILGVLAVIPAEATPTPEQLGNIAYTGIFEHAITLTNGRWEGEPFVAGGSSRPAVGLIDDFILTGDLNADGNDEAVVLLWESTGGSGVYTYLAVTALRDDKPYTLDTALIGERVQVRAGRIIGNRIELDVVQQGPGDAACCPSQTATHYWVLDASGLHVNPSRITGTLSLADLAGTEWVLNRLDVNEKLAPQPEITLVFDGDRISGKSACNRYFAGVKEGDELPGDMRISEIGGTRMACPDEVMNLEKRYLDALGKVTRYSFMSGKLALTWRKNGATGALLFVPRQPQQPQGVGDQPRQAR
ncbi:MAG: META domain-containing protein [Gammaproteobacteria bacterium]